MRVRQAAHVEHQVGVERHAVLEAERLEQQREPAGGTWHEVADPARAARRGCSSLVSMRWRRGSRCSASSSRSRSIASGSVRRPSPSGWRRRVSEKRWMQRVVLRVEEEDAHVDAGACAATRDAAAARRAPRRCARRC